MLDASAYLSVGGITARNVRRHLAASRLLALKLWFEEFQATPFEQTGLACGQTECREMLSGVLAGHGFGFDLYIGRVVDHAEDTDCATTIWLTGRSFLIVVAQFVSDKIRSWF